MRLPVLTLLAGVACTDGSAEWTAIQDGEDAQDALLGAQAGDFTESTRVALTGAARWSPGGDRWDHNPSGRAPMGPLTVVDPGTQVGVVVRAHPVDMLLYLERPDLHRAPWGWARAMAEPDRNDPALGHFLVSPGTPLHLDVQEGGVWETELGPDGAHLGWVADADLDEVFDATLATPDWVLAGPKDTWERVVIAPDTAFVDAPGGSLLTVADHQGSLSGLGSVFRVGPPTQGHIPVIAQPGWLRTPGLELRAWIADDAVLQGCFGTSGGASWGCGGSATWGSTMTHQVPAGSWVRESPAGDVVAVLVEDTLVDSTDEDWLPLRVWSPWGTVELWMDGDDVEDRAAPEG